MTTLLHMQRHIRHSTAFIITPITLTHERIIQMRSNVIWKKWHLKPLQTHKTHNTNNIFISTTTNTRIYHWQRSFHIKIINRNFTKNIELLYIYSEPRKENRPLFRKKKKNSAQTPIYRPIWVKQRQMIAYSLGKAQYFPQIPISTHFWKKNNFHQVRQFFSKTKYWRILLKISKKSRISWNTTHRSACDF